MRPLLPAPFDVAACGMPSRRADPLTSAIIDYERDIERVRVASYAMTHGERQAEIARLMAENRGALATPLMSEGAISPMQVGLMSHRQHRRYVDDAQRRMALEAHIRQLSKSDDQLRREQAAERQKHARDRLLQIARRCEDLRHVGVSKATGKVRPTFQRELDALHVEAEAILAEQPDLRHMMAKEAAARSARHPARR